MKVSMPAASRSSLEKSDSESDISIKSTKRVLRHHRKLADISSTSESSLSSPVRKFPKRKIKNKPNYYEDPNDLSIPKRPEPEEKEAPVVPLPVTKKFPTIKKVISDLDVKLPLPTPSPPNTIPQKKIVIKKLPLMKNISKTKLTLSKKIIKKKKPGWSLGIIKKKKRRSNSSTPTHSMPDDQDAGGISDMEDSVADLTPLPPPPPPQRPPSPPMVSEMAQENDTILVEPDANYYFDPQEKSFCKICPFKGKWIVQHYKSNHPKYEVLISRITPDEVKRAIKESIDNGYDEIEVPQSDEKARRRKFTYQCRFCHTFFKNETTETFFDHLTSHTGEYRFACTLCAFKTSNSKSLRSHYHTTHTANFEQTGLIFPVYETPPSYHILFGYVCSECYFIQLDETAIRNHMQIYHLGDNNRVFKISMSMIVVKQPVESIETEQAVPEETIKNNVITDNTDKGFLTSPKPAGLEKLEKSDKTVKVNKPIEQSTIAKPNKINKSNTVSKADNVSVAKKKSKKIPVFKKKVSLKNRHKKMFNKANKNNRLRLPKPVLIESASPATTETPVTDTKPNERIVKPIENLSAFQDSGEFDKDLEINEEVMEDVPIVFPKRCNFNLLDKIKNRLDETKREESMQEEGTKDKLKQEESAQEIFTATDDFNKPSCSYKTAESKSPKYVSQKKSLPNETCSIQKENIITAKNWSPINNIIERLQGKLKADVIQKPPDNTLIIPKTEETVLQVGPITATKRDDYILYSCNIHSCAFSTTVAHEFSIHCTNLHDGSQWNRFCNICDAVLEHCGFEAVDAYNHLANMHLIDDVEIVNNEISGAKPLLTNDTDGSSLVENSDNDLPFKIVSVGTVEEQPTESHDFPFLLSDFRTLSSDESETSDSATIKSIRKKAGISNLAIMSTTTVSGTSTITQSRKNLVAIPLVTSVCKSPPALQPFTKTVLPALVPVSKSSIPPLAPKVQELSNQSQSPSPQRASKRILLRDTPLLNEELLKDRKSSTALTAFLTETKLAHLYKCPEFNCTFSTDSKRAFDAHLHQHSEISRDTQVPCLYCNYKTEFANIAIHYDVRHSKCTHCCIYCLYRAVNQPYVEMHQDLKHHGMPRQVLVVPINQDALLSQANITLLPIRDVVPPFLCSCKKKFLFGSDILKHAKAEHAGILTCGYCFVKLSHLESVVVHMQVHNVCHNHCRYCLYGSTNTDDIYKHLSLQHFAHPPQIVTRRFDTNKMTDSNKMSFKIPSNYDYDFDDEIFEYLKIITHEYFAYFTPSARKEFTASSSVNRVVKSGNTATKMLPNIPIPIDTVKDSNPQKARPNSPVVINKLLKFGSGFMEILPLSASGITSNTTTNINSTLAKLNNDLTIPTTATKTMMTTSSETNSEKLVLNVQQDSEVSVTDKTRSSEVESKESDKNETLSITPSESDISVENSLSEVMDLTFSDSSEQFSDLITDESSMTPCKKIGLSGRNLFRCSFCKAGFELPQDIRSHVVKCVEMNNSSSLKPYKCAHCVKAFKNVNNLLEHLRLHGTDRFACSLCDFKALHHSFVRQHMKTKHKVTNVTIIPVDRQKQDYDCDEFIIRPKSNRQKNLETVTKNSNISNTDEKTFEKLMYAPEEYEALPFRPIFARDLGCSVCGFTTKVKANLSRHLRLHLENATVPVPTSAPINPVPCLEKNEKMFDKMTNLSHSGYNSNSSRMSYKNDKKDVPLNELTKEEQEHIPLFVPSTKRNVCGATGCDYLCLDDSMFKCHLAALHGTELFYKCKHCETVLSSGEGIINVDLIIKHQKLHDLNLYKCKYCPYLYNVKHKVEHHITEAHPDGKVNVVAIREMTREPIDTSSYEREREREEIKETNPWRCGMCKFRCTFKSEIVTHILIKHELDEGQYKCALCTFKSNTMNAFSSHFETEHPGQTIDVIDVYYKVEDKTPTETVAFDTTPIWKLNRNSNYIRGIPIEGSKSPKKSPMKSSMSDNLEKSIESVATGTSSIIPKFKPIKERKSENAVSVEDKSAKVKERRKSIPIAKKLKALKEKASEQSVEIIEIDDDAAIDTEENIVVEEKPIIVEEKPNVTAEKKPLFTVEGETEDIIVTTLEEIETMDLAVLMKGNIKGKYGLYFGKPFRSKYLCPRCGTFKTSVVNDITNHIYKDLNYYKFICTICRLYGVTYDFLRTHSKNRHPHRPESIIPLSPDNQIEEYVQMVIAVQNRIINAKKSANPNSAASVKSNVTIATSIVEEASSTTSAENEKLIKPKPQIHSCPHCNYTCKNLCDIRKHEKRHWLQKPLKCGYCDLEGVTNNEITVHSKRVHPNNEPMIVSIPMPSSPTIQPIARKRKRRSSVAVTKPVSDSSFASNDSFQGDDSSHSEVEPAYVCNYCHKKFNTQDEIESHSQIAHSTKDPKYRKIVSGQVSKKNAVNYKCFHCDFISTLDAIKNHFRMDHPTLALSLYRYQCSYCLEYFRKAEKVKAHCKKLHGDENPEHLDIKINNAPNTTKEFACEYCNLQYHQEQELFDHNKNMHSHLKINTVSNNIDKSNTAVNIVTPEPEVAVEDKKHYKCPECAHSSNSCPAIVEHLRSHAKPIRCWYCHACFSHPANVKTHTAKEHSDLPAKYVSIDGALQKLEILKKDLLVLKDGEYIPMSVAKPQKRVRTSPTKSEPKRPKTAIRLKPTARKSTTQLPVMKETARKSTTQFIPIIELDDDDEDEDEGFSYYGTPPDMEGVEEVKASVSLLDKMF